MTSEEAIEAIKMAVSQVEWEYPLDYAAAFDVAIKALEKQSKWIPVSERLPEEMGYLEVYRHSHILTEAEKCGCQICRKIVKIFDGRE